MRRVAATFLPRQLTGAQKENRVTVSQELFDLSNATPLSRNGPCGRFLVPEVKILTKRSPISDGRGDRRKFDTGPSCHPAKHVPGRVPELEKTLGAVCQERRGVLWRRQIWLSCMWSSKLKTKKVRFLYGLPSYTFRDNLSVPSSRGQYVSRNVGRELPPYAA